MLVCYLDLAFLVNCLADALTLLVTARLGGLPVHRGRLMTAAVLGGLYGALCLLPPLACAAGLPAQLIAAAALVYLAFGGGRDYLRRLLLFFLLSCTMGGVLMALVRLAQEEGAAQVLGQLNWSAFFLTGGGCYLLLSVVFRGGARHVLSGQLRRGRLLRRGRKAEFTALLDTGHTLTDWGGRPVLVAEASSLAPLWDPAEGAVLSELESRGAAWCMEALGRISPGVFRLLPYRAVGTASGLLLCFMPDRAELEGSALGQVTVALSPTPVSDGGGYSALWGGEGGKGERSDAA